MAQIDKNTVKADNQLGKNPRITFEYANNDGKRILFVGNSITRHSPKAEIGWTGDWGMAASSKEKDYVHRTISKIMEKTPNPLFCICQAADWERLYKDGTTQHSLFQEAADFSADIIVIRLIENCPKHDFACEVFYEEYGKFIDFLNKTGNAKIIVTSAFWKHPGDSTIEKYAKDKNLDFVLLNELGEDPKMRADNLFEHGGVAAHPGDLGMETISDMIFEKIEKYL